MVGIPPAQPEQCTGWAMWLDFSSRFLPSSLALSHPCCPVWFRFFSSWAKFQFPQLIRYPFQLTWEHELLHKMLLSGACERSSQKQISSSEHVISACTWEHVGDPRAEALGCQGYQCHFTQPQAAAAVGGPAAVQYTAMHTDRFRMGNKEGDHVQLQPQGTKVSRCNYLWCTSLPPNF